MRRDILSKKWKSVAESFRRRAERAREEAAREVAKYENIEIYGAGILKLKDEYLASDEWKEKVKRGAEVMQKRLERRRGRSKTLTG